MLSILRSFFLAFATFLGGLLITFTTPLKLFGPTELFCYKISTKIAQIWGDSMRWLITKTIPIDYQITGDKPDPTGTYLLIANHRSWIDIMMVMVVLGPGTTLPRFFMKWALVYIPVIGSCAFALDFPIMRRYSQEAIKKNPNYKNRDFNYAKLVLSRHLEQSCVVVNFAEGTRFTKEKHAKSRSPYRHLLKPKIGGPQLTLDCLRDRLDGIIDITLCYPNAELGMWSLLSGKIPLVKIHTVLLEVPCNLQKSSGTLADLKAFRSFMNQRWMIKDNLLDQMLTDTQEADRTSP